jgi:hypothetical protein
MATLKPRRFTGAWVGMDHPATSERARAEIRNLISAAIVEADDMRRRILLIMADHWRLAAHGGAKPS